MSTRREAQTIYYTVAGAFAARFLTLLVELYCARKGRRTPKEAFMNIDRAVIGFAGALVLASLALSQIHHPYWLWLTAFVGANLLQSSFSGFSPDRFWSVSI